MNDLRPSFRQTTTRVRGAWVLLAGLLAGFLLLSMSTPWLEPGPRWMVYRLFAPVCHQIPERSLRMGGVPLALCHRCFAIYVGLFVSAAGFWWASRWDGWLWTMSRWVMLGVMALIGLDWLLDVLLILENTPTSRSLTGVAFGLGAGYFLVRGILELAGWSGRGSRHGQG